MNLTQRRGIESARERNEIRAYYACGAVFALIAESASGRSFFTFVKTLVDSNGSRHREPRRMAGSARRAVEKPDLSRDIARMLDPGRARSEGIHRIAVQARRLFAQRRRPGHAAAALKPNSS